MREGGTGKKEERYRYERVEREEERQTKHRHTDIDITGTANGTACIKQIEIVYTGRGGKRMKERDLWPAE